MTKPTTKIKRQPLFLPAPIAKLSALYAKVGEAAQKLVEAHELMLDPSVGPARLGGAKAAPAVFEC